MPAKPELCCFLWVHYVWSWCGQKDLFLAQVNFQFNVVYNLKDFAIAAQSPEWRGVPGKLQSFLNLPSTSYCSTVWHPQGAWHAVPSSVESQEILSSFVWGEEKLDWNLSTVILKMETGFVPYLAKLVMRDSCSLIKYECILLLP